MRDFLQLQLEKIYKGYDDLIFVQRNVIDCHAYYLAHLVPHNRGVKSRYFIVAPGSLQPMYIEVDFRCQLGDTEGQYDEGRIWAAFRSVTQDAHFHYDEEPYSLEKTMWQVLDRYPRQQWVWNQEKGFIVRQSADACHICVHRLKKLVKHQCNNTFEYAPPERVTKE